MKKALISGITGQDGSYLAELLLQKGYEVHGIKRRSSSFNTQRLDHLYQDPHSPNPSLILHYGDLTDSGNLQRLIEQIAPDEVYNLAAQSHVRVSFDLPSYTANVDALGTVRLLEALRQAGARNTRFYQASTSELYGNAGQTPQNELTPFAPQSPYAAAKLYSYWLVRIYRQAYGAFAANGILFNHESERRGETFVTRKITRAAARIKLNRQDCLYLGNLDARRDWGHAQDYVNAMWLIMQQPKADDYVIATGQMHSVRQFVEHTFAWFGMPLTWQGSGVDECGIHAPTGKVLVKIDPRYFRPLEVETLQGDYSKAKAELGWEPQISFEQLVERMCQHDYALAKQEQLLAGHGYSTPHEDD